MTRQPGQVRAVVVGSLVSDLAFRIPRMPAPGEVVAADEFGVFRGGKGYNQAVALARLGAEVTMVGAVGHDEAGNGFLRALEREGVDAGRVVTLRGTATSTAVPLITPDGDVRFVQYPGANHQLSAAHAADLPECDVLLLQGEVPPATSEQAAQVIRNRGALVVLNPAPVHEVSQRMLALASVVIPNEIEARTLLSLPEAEGLELARALVTDDRSAVVTLGAAGAAWATGGEGGEAGHVTPPSITAVDATAAGDSFCAALALRLAEGAVLPEAVAFACAAGAHAATVRGAEPGLPTRAQVDALLNA